MRSLLSRSIGALVATLAIATALAQSNGLARVSERSRKGDVCNSLPGWKEISDQKSRFLVFGELHGTNESPAFVGNLACSLARKGKRTLVAIEIDSKSNGNLQMAWRSPHKRFAALTLREGWSGPNSGNTSAAMLRMLTKLHALKSAGLDISVVAFSGFKSEDQRRRFGGLPGQESGEAASAENIEEAARKGSDYILVLTGNVHAGKVRFERNGSSFKPMAVYLEQYGKVLSLNMATSGGTGWGCALKAGMYPGPAGKITNDMFACGPQHISAGVELRPPFSVGLGAPPGETPDPTYDGYYWVGATSASPPAIATS